MLFNYDMFIIAYSYLLAVIISSMFEINNVDVKGWWPIIIIIETIYAIVGGFIFALFSQLLPKDHQSYTHKFALALFFGYLLISGVPVIFDLNYTYRLNLFLLLVIAFSAFHLVACLISFWNKKYKY